MSRPSSAIERVRDSGLAAASSLFYAECEFCTCLFPLDMVTHHLKLHEFESGTDWETNARRRMFACTDVSDMWYADDNIKQNTKTNVTVIKLDHPQEEPCSSVDMVDATDSSNNNNFEPAPSKKPVVIRKHKLLTKSSAPLDSNVIKVVSDQCQTSTPLRACVTRSKRETQDTLRVTPSRKPRQQPSVSVVFKKRKGKSSSRFIRKRRTLARSEQSNINEELFNPENGTSKDVASALDDLPPPDYERFPGVPDCFDTRFAVEKPCLRGKRVVEFRARIGTAQDVKLWVKVYGEQSMTKWLLKGTVIKRNTHVLNFVCSYKHLPKRKPLLADVDCTMRVQISISTVCPIASIMLIGEHNHELDDSKSVRKDETRQQFESYCRAGLRVRQAHAYHERWLRSLPDFEPEWLHDTSVLPTVRQVGEIYHAYKKEHPECIKMLQTSYVPNDIDEFGYVGDARFAQMQQTAREFYDYVRKGMTASEMRAHHEHVLRARPDFKEYMLEDEAYMPSRERAHYFRKNYAYQLRSKALRSGAPVASTPIETLKCNTSRSRPDSASLEYRPEYEDEMVDVD